MKTFFRISTPSLVLILCSTALAVQAAPDFSLVQKLPEREIAAKKAAHLGWDSGVMGKMLDATAAYNEALTGMVNDLAAAYYGKAKVTKEDVAAYVKTLHAAADFRHRLDNPANEDRGTADALEAPSVVSNDLEDTVEQMAEAVTGDDEHFDVAAWEKRWEEAKKFGDQADKALVAPTPAGADAAPKGTPPETRDKPN